MLASRFKFLVCFKLVHGSISSSALRAWFCLARFATLLSKSWFFFIVSSLHFCAIFWYLAAALFSHRFMFFGAYDTEAGMGVEIGVGDSGDGMHSCCKDAACNILTHLVL